MCTGTCCQTALVSVASLIKAFQNKPLLLALCGLKKSVSWYWCLFIYKHQYAWQWKKKKNNLCITLCSDTSCAHMHLFVLVHGKKRKVTTLLSFVIALLQHRNTQRATNKPQAVTLIHKRCHDHWIIVTKLSKTVHLTLVHIARFYWTDSTGHSQKYRDKIQNRALADCHDCERKLKALDFKDCIT